MSATFRAMMRGRGVVICDRRADGMDDETIFEQTARIASRELCHLFHQGIDLSHHSWVLCSVLFTLLKCFPLSKLTELNLMMYDFHGSWNDKTGVNAPLYDQEGSPEFSVHGKHLHIIFAGLY